MKRFSGRFRVVVYFPGGIGGPEHSAALTWVQAGIYVRNAMRRARSIPGLVVRVMPLMGGVA